MCYFCKKCKASININKDEYSLSIEGGHNHNLKIEHSELEKINNITENKNYLYFTIDLYNNEFILLLIMIIIKMKRNQ